MKTYDWVTALETLAPPSLAMEYDNVGLLIGTTRTEIKKVLVALDCTLDTAEEAASWGADALLTHHPIFFEPVRRIDPYSPATAGAYVLLRAGVAHYAAHTNLDAAHLGVNDCLCERLRIQNVSLLPPENLGRIGTLEKECALEAFAAFVEEELSTTVRFCGDAGARVRKVAVVGGAGGDDVKAARLAGADTFITGELKHKQALEALALGLQVIEAGHFETEIVVLEPWIKRLQALSDDVQYKLARSESAPLRGLRSAGPTHRR